MALTCPEATLWELLHCVPRMLSVLCRTTHLQRFPVCRKPSSATPSLLLIELVVICTWTPALFPVTQML